MFIKLPSGCFFRIDHIVTAYWGKTEYSQKPYKVSCTDGETWDLFDENAKALESYLESISFTHEVYK